MNRRTGSATLEREHSCKKEKRERGAQPQGTQEEERDPFLRVDWAQVEGVRFLRPFDCFSSQRGRNIFFLTFFVLNCSLFWGFMPGVSVQFSFQFPLQSALWQCLGKKNRYTNKIELKRNWVTVLPSSWVSKKKLPQVVWELERARVGVMLLQGSVVTTICDNCHNTHNRITQQPYYFWQLYFQKPSLLCVKQCLQCFPQPTTSPRQHAQKYNSQSRCSNGRACRWHLKQHCLTLFDSQPSVRFHTVKHIIFSSSNYCFYT